MKENNFISVVLYYHNVEHSILHSFSDKLYNGLLQHFKNYEIVIANDSSDDVGLDILISALNHYVEHNTITVINFPEYVGIETAMLAGDDLTIGDYIYEFDNLNMDFNQDFLSEMYQITLQGNDIVSAGPVEPDVSLFSKTFYKVYNRGVSANQQLTTEVLRILSRRAFNRAKSMAKVISYRKAIYAAGGMKRCHLTDESIRILNKHDKSEVKMRWQLAINSLMLFTNVIQRISFFISCLFLVIVMVITVYIVSVFVLSKPVAGWTPIMMYLSIGFFGVFALFSVILKYLSLILNLIYQKDTYVVESIRKV